MKAIRLLAVACVTLLLLAAPAMAAEPEHGTHVFTTKHGAAGFGVALAIIGAGIGFGKIGSAALESMARQPEVAKDIRGTMIVVAALLEGATFFGLLICLIALFTN